MSVQKVNPNFSLETTCPIVINATESIFAYQTASSVSINKDVNGRSSGCFPTDYAYLQVYTAEAAKKCCDNNALNKNKSVANMMSYRY